MEMFIIVIDIIFSALWEVIMDIGISLKSMTSFVATSIFILYVLNLIKKDVAKKIIQKRKVWK